MGEVKRPWSVPFTGADIRRWTEKGDYKCARCLGPMSLTPSRWENDLIRLTLVCSANHPWTEVQRCIDYGLLGPATEEELA